ncbi:adp-ribosylation factor 1 [Stylonychia lemnae]|uniref:Adp-ribosylation factor 1 n=1 Tax=Stylonychia lemnae TaxID=5949 RepID=A0A078BDT2_STYLE|nr:adp-ribosylation factor 1 [Stylonychia lemnae]|eukprot:CDW91738.1 adp-ribosylation factor 1 [Stylonychia lemnae]
MSSQLLGILGLDHTLKILCDIITRIPNIPVLIFANKMDLGGNMTPSEIIEKLDINPQMKRFQWMIQECSAVQYQGVNEGLIWLTNKIVKNSKQK